MGTRLDLVFTAEPPASLLEIAQSLLKMVAVPGTDLVVVHFDVAERRGVRLLATNVTDGTRPLPLPDQVARILSKRSSPALHQWYSDSTGEAGYAIFERGSQKERVDTPIPGKEPLFPRFQEGFERTFPEWADLGPEELLDLIYAPESRSESFVLSRGGSLLPSPERYEAPIPAPAKRSLFNGEFAWGRQPRKWLRGCLIAYGVLVALVILWAAGWWLMEMLRG
jgi:hypothetical protein